MKRKISIITTVLTCTMLTVGCNNLNDSSTQTNVDNSSTQSNNDIPTEYIQGDVDENTYKIDTSLDKKEHTFKLEDERPIIEAFTEATQGMSPQAIEELFARCGNISVSGTYTIEPSEYEMFDITVVNNEQEEVSVTYKDGSLISKRYKKDTFDDSNKNMVFVNYKSNLFKQEYSSGIYGEVVDKNIAENKNVWEIEEELFKIFN